MSPFFFEFLLVTLNKLLREFTDHATFQLNLRPRNIRDHARSYYVNLQNCSHPSKYFYVESEGFNESFWWCDFFIFQTFGKNFSVKKGWWWGTNSKKFLDKISLSSWMIYSVGAFNTSLYKSLSCFACVVFNGNCILSTYRSWCTLWLQDLDKVYFGLGIIFYTASRVFRAPSIYLFFASLVLSYVNGKTLKRPRSSTFWPKRQPLLHFAHTLRPIIAQKSQL